MNARKLGKLRSRLAAMRRSPQRATALESLARQLGRQRAKRGKEPMWEGKDLGLFPLAIPHHGGQDLAVGTKNRILDQLEEDILAWEERLSEEDDG